MAKAYAYFQRAAELGNAESYCSLGYMQHKGFGTERNDEQAIKSYKSAADLKAPCGHTVRDDVLIEPGDVDIFAEEFEEPKEKSATGDSAARSAVGIHILMAI